ncbi:MAG: flavin reductase family protein [Bacteroidota bacterium]
MYYSKADLAQLEHRERINLINSVSGIKPVNLIGTASASGATNLAIFSSVVHLGSNPALLGFILRPHQEVRRHTYENILATGVFTLNHVHRDFVQRAHYTSAKFPDEVSEFAACGLHEAYREGFAAPFVRESQLQLGLRYRESIPIPLNRTTLVIGEVENATIPDRVREEGGHLDLSRVDDVGLSGLNSYYALEKIAQFPYARPEELPQF